MSDSRQDSINDEYWTHQAAIALSEYVYVNARRWKNEQLKWEFESKEEHIIENSKTKTKYCRDFTTSYSHCVNWNLT